ncbi:hypothetical protein COOONC_08839, partial [Cooperia oncophora]
YLLKKDRKKMEEQDKENRISPEKRIRKSKISESCTFVEVPNESHPPVVHSMEEEEIRREEAERGPKKAKKDKIKAGKALGMSGRDLFTFNADACVDDEDAEDVDFEEEVGPDEKCSRLTTVSSNSEVWMTIWITMQKLAKCWIAAGFFNFISRQINL